MKKLFPADFNWGVATTAIQIEGGVDTDGRGLSMWPHFARQSGKIWHGDTPHGSAASYEHLNRDLDALQALNLKSYNFTASWTRILPNGQGATNQRGIDYYNRLIDGLLARGITPDFSLYDWDLPLAYSQAGGWTQRDLKDRFGEYVDTLLRHYGDRVERWMTFNEISTQASSGYHKGGHAPGHESFQDALQAFHHLLLAHGESVQRIRAAVPQAKISLVDNYMQYYPASVSAADRNARNRTVAFESHYLLDAVFRGKVNSTVAKMADKLGCNLRHILPGDLSTIHQKIDEYGVNYFTAFTVADSKEQPGKAQSISAAEGPKSPFGWTIDPVGLREALRTITSGWTDDLPLFIGECGIGQVDYVGPDGKCHDPERIDYLYKHLEQVHYAIAEDHIPIQGFYVWSLMDNYEWDQGYKKRMGLHYTDYANPQKYVRKDSGDWYAHLCKTGELSPD